MATTTNYSWTTPDDTALVKDGASAIRTLGSSVDTTTKNLNPSTTLGDIEYRSSTANVNTRLGLGTAGQVLTVNSGATAPEWKSISYTLLNAGGTALTGATTITVSSLSGYNKFYVAIEGVSSVSADSNFTIRFNADSASNYTYNGMSYANKTPNPLPASWLPASANATSLPLLGGIQSAAAAQNGAFTIDGANTAGLKIVDLIGINNWQATDALSYIYKARYSGTSVISSISIISSSGNFDAGTIYVYGAN